MDVEDRLVSVTDLARIYGLSTRTIYRWVWTNRVPFLKVSPKCLRFDPAKVRAALEDSHQSKGGEHDR